jgi:hypothetical protein
MATTKTTKKTKTPKKTKGDGKKHVCVRLDLEIVARLEALAKNLSNAWLTAKLSDSVRAALLRGLPLVEAEYEKKSGRG